MADVVRLLPRLWDGQRALRFLAGLAMLALAFAANAGLVGPAALSSAPAPVTVVSASTSVVPDSSAGSDSSAASVSAGSVSAAVAASVPAASVPVTSASAASPVVVDDAVVVTPLVFAAVLGLLVVLVCPVGRRGAGRVAGGAPVQRGPPLS